MAFLKNKNYYVAFSCMIVLLLVFLLLPSKTFAVEIEAVSGVLKNESGMGGQIQKIWKEVMNVVNAFVIVILIATAFSQILRLNINTYGVKKILPSLIFAIIAANFSYLFCRLMVDFSSVIMDLFLNGTSVTGGIRTVGIDEISNGVDTTSKFLSTEGTLTAASILWMLVGGLLKIAGAILIYILAYLFLIRNWIIYFLVPIAPLAIMSMVLPQSKTLFNQWWSNFAKWVFMPIVSLFWIWLGVLWFDSIQSLSSAFLLTYVFSVACFYLALTTPFKMGGGIMQKWGDLGKKAWGKTGGAALGGAWNSTKWAAGGGVASIMTHRNQMAAERAGLEGRKADEKKFKRKASAWTALNLRAQREAIKGRFEADRKTYDGAAKKTGYYNTLAGAAASAQAGYDANEDYKYKTPTEIGQMLNKAVRGPEGAWNKISKEHRDKLLADSGGDEREAQRKLAQYFAGTGIAKLVTIMHGSGMSNFEIGELKRIAQQFTSLGRGVKATEADTAFYASSPVYANVPQAAIVQMPGIKPSTVCAAVASGARSFGDLNLDLKDKSPDERANIEKYVNDMIAARDNIESAILARGAEHIEEKMKGIEMIEGRVSSGSYRSVSAMREHLEQALRKINSAKQEDIISAIEDTQSLSGINIKGFSADSTIQTQKAQQVLSHLSQGLGALDSQLGEGVHSIGVDADWGEVKQKVRQSLQENLSKQAVIGAGAEMSNRFLETKYGQMPIGQLHSNEQFVGDFHEQLQGIHEAIVNQQKAEGPSMAQTATGLGVDATAVRGALANAVNNAVGNMGMTMTTSLKEAMTSKQFRDSMTIAQRTALETAKQKPAPATPTPKLPKGEPSVPKPPANAS